MNFIQFTNDSLKIAKLHLLEPYSLDETILNKALNNIVTSPHVEYADLYFQSSCSETWHIEEGIVKVGNFNINQGVGVRAIAGEHTAFAYSDELSAQAIEKAVSTTRTIGQYGGFTKVNFENSLSYKKNSHVFKMHNLYSKDDPMYSIDTNKKISLLENIEHIAKAKDPRVKQVVAGLSCENDIVLIARSDGIIVADIRPLVRLSIMVIAEQNKRKEMGNSGGGGRFNYTYFTNDILNQYVDDAVNTALINLESRPAPAGNMTVVLGSGWPGILLHEAIGHGLEGDFNRKGSSAFANRIGEQVAAKNVTVVDNGTLPKKRGSLNIDDEGNPTQCTVLIENGILKNYMQDAFNAKLMGMSITGNARRESYASLPMPRMTNTYMLNGDKDPNEIIESVDKGIYASNFGGGQVDITNGKFAFSASEAYMIENGKLTYPIKGATLIGNGPESLKYITMIGNNMSLDQGVGVCGKDGQTVPVSVGQPTLRIEQLTVGGTS